MKISDLEKKIEQIEAGGMAFGGLNFAYGEKEHEVFFVYPMPEGDWGIFVDGIFSDGFETIADAIRFGLKESGRASLMDEEGRIYAQAKLFPARYVEND